MAVHFAIRIGDKSVGYVEARRTGTCHCTKPEHTHPYAVTVTRHATPTTPARTVTTNVSHRYGAGVFALTATVLAATHKEMTP